MSGILFFIFASCHLLNCSNSRVACSIMNNCHEYDNCLRPLGPFTVTVILSAFVIWDRKCFILHYFSITVQGNPFFLFFLFFFISYFTWVFIQVLSPVLPWSPGPECAEQFDCRDGFFIAHMFRAAHKQWKVAILILINTSAPIKFRIVEMETD